jgi:hypothetical protein
MTEKDLGPAAVATAAEPRKNDLARINFQNKSPAANPQAAKNACGERAARQKGGRTERGITNDHSTIRVHAERDPQSGAIRFRGKNHDIDLYAFGKDEPPLVREVRAHRSGRGFTILEEWHDVLFLRRNNAMPLIALPWKTWARLLKRVRP